jgi:hypothetical protein
MAESGERILCSRALTGQHLNSAAELITWPKETVPGWKTAPAPSCGTASAETVASERNMGVE